MAVTDNLNIGHELGFDRGFDRFQNFHNVGAETVNEKVREFVDAEKAEHDSPYFLYVHYMDPHMPYQKHRPWYDECAPKGTSKHDKIICSYDSEIRETDRRIAELFERYDWLKNSIVIFTADHGEEFWDHGNPGHGKTLYTELIRVPFIVYHPARPARVIDANMQPTDILPTLAQLMGLEQKAEWEGKSLRHLLNGEPCNWPDRNIFSERLRLPESDLPAKRSVIVGNAHLIETTSQVDDALILREFFDLGTDFAEARDVYSTHESAALGLAGVLAEHKKQAETTLKNEKVEIPLDQDMLKQLRSLGYLK